MVKHTETIVFDHFVGLALKGLFSKILKKTSQNKKII